MDILYIALHVIKQTQLLDFQYYLPVSSSSRTPPSEQFYQHRISLAQISSSSLSSLKHQPIQISRIRFYWNKEEGSLLLYCSLSCSYRANSLSLSSSNLEMVSAKHHWKSEHDRSFGKQFLNPNSFGWHWHWHWYTFIHQSL